MIRLAVRCKPDQADLVLAETSGEAGLVVVAQDVVGPSAGGEFGFVFADELCDAVGVPGGLDEVEVEWHVRAV